jgi:hypothetical protein
MKQSLYRPFKVMVIITGFLFIFFLGMESLALARAGSGKSSGSRGYSSGGSYQRSTPGQPRQQVAPQRSPVQQPQQPSAGKSFLSGLGGGLVGGHAREHAFWRQRTRRWIRPWRWGWWIRFWKLGTHPHHPWSCLFSRKTVQSEKIGGGLEGCRQRYCKWNILNFTYQS